MNTDLSIAQLFLHASPLVKFIMLLLVALSVVSWTFIFQRGKTLKNSESAMDNFEDTFWSGTDLGQIFERLNRQTEGTTGLENIFKSGFREFIRLRKQDGVVPDAVMEGAQRAMRVALSREQENLEKHLSFLATVGSVSPYIGLFGTVWGIMNSFRALSMVEQATLAMVAPGISEALVATAMGLFAAIPAVIAYNRYANRVQYLLHRCDTFQEEFTSILHRKAHTTVKAAG